MITEFIKNDEFLKQIFSCEELFVFFDIFRFIKDKDIVADSLFMFYLFMRKCFKKYKKNEVSATFLNILKTDYFKDIYDYCISLINKKDKKEGTQTLSTHLTLFVKQFFTIFKDKLFNFKKV